MKKKFKDTAIGGFLTKAAPHILEAVGDTFPPVKLLKSLIDNTPGVSDVDRAELNKQLHDYEIEELKIRLDDVNSAREMQIQAMQQSDNFTKRFIYWLAAGSLVLGFAYVFFITFWEIPEANIRFADTILGVVIATIITTIYNFFFGSSDGSKKKDDINKMLSK